MRILLSALICACLLAWPAASWAPSGVGSAPAALIAASDIRLNGARFSAPVPSRPPSETSLQHVIDAALRHRVPIRYLLAIWQRECSSASTCRIGDGGQSFGPYQVQAIAAWRSDCMGKWRGGESSKNGRRVHGGPDNADCAARILRDFYDQRGTWRRAIAAYNSPAHRWDKPNSYALEIEGIIRGWQLAALAQR